MTEIIVADDDGTIRLHFEDICATSWVDADDILETTHRTYLQSQIAATIGRTASRLNVIAFLVSLKEEDKFEGEQVDEAMEAMSYIGLLDDATKIHDHHM